MGRAERLGQSEASLKEVKLEPGSNFPVIVLPDADLEKAYRSVHCQRGRRRKHSHQPGSFSGAPTSCPTAA